MGLLLRPDVARGGAKRPQLNREDPEGEGTRSRAAHGLTCSSSLTQKLDVTLALVVVLTTFVRQIRTDDYQIL